MAESEMKAGAQSTQWPTPERTTLIAFGMSILLAGGAPVAVRFTYADLAPTGVPRCASLTNRLNLAR